MFALVSFSASKFIKKMKQKDENGHAEEHAASSRQKELKQVLMEKELEH
jgi:hypothetical protein